MKKIMGKMEPGFNLYEFKKWLSDKSEELQDEPELKRFSVEVDPLIGAKTTIKVSENKIIESCEIIKGIKETAVVEFISNGGTITENHGKRVFVEVSSGVLSIPRFCVSIIKDKK